MKNKKGISAIVATVLIILITVAAVTIIWVAIIPMINNQLSSGTVCLDAVSAVQLKDEGYTCIESDGTVSLQVARTARDFDLNGLQVLISIDGDTSTEEIDLTSSPLLPNSVGVYTTTNTYAGADKIQIAPIVGVGNTQQTCDVSATLDLVDC